LKKLGVLLCYNDADFLKICIDHLIDSGHDIVVWDHGSTDDTSKVLDSFGNLFVERKFVPRSFDFYKLYPSMSQNLIDNYIKSYDWISWPDQDEILEGPNRSKTYSDYLDDVYEGGYDYICFNNINFWHTEDDDIAICDPVRRIKHYSIFPDCSPRIRSWRACKTNLRRFNHNAVGRYKYPINFNLRHYPMRSNEQMMERLLVTRANLSSGATNIHYENMKSNIDRLLIPGSYLHYDDGSDLNLAIKYDWRTVYGYGKPQSRLQQAGNRLKKILKR